MFFAPIVLYYVSDEFGLYVVGPGDASAFLTSSVHSVFCLPLPTLNSAAFFLLILTDGARYPLL